MHHRSILLSAALLLLTSLGLCAQDTVTVRKVIDGTSFTTDDGRTVRLLGVTLPISRAVTVDDCRQHLADLLAPGVPVRILIDSLVPSHGTALLCHVEVAGELVNRRMLLDGYAAASNAPRHSLSDEFAKAEKSARTDKLGAWSSERATAVQCSGTTQSGNRCKRMTTSLSGRCWQHEK